MTKSLIKILKREGFNAPKLVDAIAQIKSSQKVSLFKGYDSGRTSKRLAEVALIDTIPLLKAYFKKQEE
ncbi:MAG: hypothetical protein PHG83_03040 [Patescibacteria group bacterium]|nr:hypothetical protein [Patescibacteria group bacterium]